MNQKGILHHERKKSLGPAADPGHGLCPGRLYPRRPGPQRRPTDPAAGTSQAPSAQPSQAPGTQQPSQEPSQPAGERETVRLAVLSGPTGVGAAKLISDDEAGTTVNDYEWTIAADNNELTVGLSSADPTFDIATVASNLAVNLYNKTEAA